MSSPPPAQNTKLTQLIRLILASHRRVVGRPLLSPEPPDGADLGAALWRAPQAVVAHGNEADPVFCYGNRLALELFELDFAAFTTLPSRLSAEPLAREERERLLLRVSRHGFIDDYSGVRISSRGRRFRIEGATVWNLVDEAGIHHGQAATFSHWRPLV